MRAVAVQAEHERLISTREGRITVAHEMRRAGHTVAEIARAVRVCPATAGVYLWENGGYREGLPHLDVQAIRGTRPRYKGHRPAQEQHLV